MTAFASRLRLASAVCGAALLSGCLVGPNYQGPPVTAPMASTPGRPFARTAGAPVTPDPPPSQWWLTMNDPLLTRLIADAFAASPTLKQAQAQIRKARATLKEERTELLPTGGANASYVHLKLPEKGSSLGGVVGPLGGAVSGVAAAGSALGQTSQLKLPSGLDLFSAGFDASWELDIFGAVRRQIESDKALAGVQDASFHDSQVQLASEVAQNYVNLRDAQRRLGLGDQVVSDDTEALRLTVLRRRGGTASDTDVENQKTQLDQDAANQVPIRIQIDQALDQLALLTGREAGALDAELAAPAPPLAPPAQVAIGDPASLLRRRPDVRKAERQLASDNALVGAQIAGYFPQVSFFGTLTVGSTDPSNLFSSKNLSALATPSISWNFLQWPQVTMKVRQQRAQRDSSLAAYQQAVLAALQDAQDQLSAFGRQRESVRQLTLAADSASHLVEINRRRYRGGTATLIDVQTSERQKAQTQQSLSQSVASLTNDYVALQKSLGLGWQEAPPPDPLPDMPGDPPKRPRRAAG